MSAAWSVSAGYAGPVQLCVADARGAACAAQEAALATTTGGIHDAPQVRFVGHPDLPANDPFLTPWLDKVAAWIDEGRTPHVYLHTPDNRLAPELALRFHAGLAERLPGLPPLPSLGEARSFP